MEAGLHQSGMKSCGWCAYPCPSVMRNQAGGTSSIRYEVKRKESMTSSFHNEESSRRDFIRLIGSRAIGGLVLVRLVRGIKQAGLRQSGMMSHDRRACPCHSSTRNQASWTSSVWYEVVRKAFMSSSVLYDESSRRDFVRPERSFVKGGLHLVRMVR